MKRQRFVLDRGRALFYIGAGILLAACPGRPAPLIPMPLVPGDRDSAVAWSAASVPTHRSAIRFRWKYQDDQHRWGGRGQARIAPPDSLRFDYVGPLGLGVGAAAIVGDSTIWADPEKNFRSLVPAVRMLWAGLGIVRPPAPRAVVFREPKGGSAGDGAGAAAGGGSGDPVNSAGAVQWWRFVEGDDTLDYRATTRSPRVLEAEWRRQGRVQARSRTEFDVHAMPASARIDFPEGRARFELTVVAVDTAA
ncbi:MAG TPA: hypothetical protein VH158_08760, partial [Gemmatimonadales bacterium]|nr:hypothetical protein [Gemmatimonadales bacterium]